MKAMILAAFAAMSLGVGAANAQSLSHNAAPRQAANQYNWLAGGGG
jgi:hypothetical protein